MFSVLRELKVNNMSDNTPHKNGPLSFLDTAIKKVIPNPSVRAIVCLSLLFMLALFIQIWRISSDHKPVTKTGETVIADETYWDSKEYHDRIKNQTVDSFTHELKDWLAGTSQEFSRRKFEDMIFINGNAIADYGGDPSTLIPENFNYLETVGRARYQYAEAHGFLSDGPALVKLGTIICDSGENTERITGIELYDWRYASMPKLAAFMNTKPDWKMQVGDTFINVAERTREESTILKSRTAETQPVGLFSFLIFRDPNTNRVTIADSFIFDKNNIDAALTLSRMSTKWDKQPKLYFKSGYEGCRDLGKELQIPYGQSH